MANLTETVWVNTFDEFRVTIDRYIAQGGVVRDQEPGATTLFVKKKINVPVLVVGLLLCLVPGLAYLAWYSFADKDQLVTVRMGKPDNIGGYHPDRPDHPAAPGDSELGTDPDPAAPTTGPAPDDQGSAGPF